MKWEVPTTNELDDRLYDWEQMLRILLRQVREMVTPKSRKLKKKGSDKKIIIWQ